MEGECPHLEYLLRVGYSIVVEAVYSGSLRDFGTVTCITGGPLPPISATPGGSLEYLWSKVPELLHAPLWPEDHPETMQSIRVLLHLEPSGVLPRSCDAVYRVVCCRDGLRHTLHVTAYGHFSCRRFAN